MDEREHEHEDDMKTAKRKEEKKKEGEKCSGDFACIIVEKRKKKSMTQSCVTSHSREKNSGQLKKVKGYRKKT